MIERHSLGDLTAVPAVHAGSSADRLLVATACSANAVAVIGDRKILEYGAGGRQGVGGVSGASQFG